jgi:hypothetical protein
MSFLTSFLLLLCILYSSTSIVTTHGLLSTVSFSSVNPRYQEFAFSNKRYFETIMRFYDILDIPQYIILIRIELGSNVEEAGRQYDQCCTVDETLCLQSKESVLAKYFAYEKQKESLPPQHILPKTTVYDHHFYARMKEKRSTSFPYKCNKKFNAGGDILTMVTGFWNIKGNKYDNYTSDVSSPVPTSSKTAPSNAAESIYYSWFENSLQINMPFIFFTGQSLFSKLSSYRQQLPTLFVHHPMERFYTYGRYNASWIHPEHVPSAEVGMIWLEKLQMVSLAMELSDSEYFAWIDAGLATYRDKRPPIHEWSKEIIQAFPKQRMLYTHTTEFYHRISAGCYIIPRDTVHLVKYLFFQEWELVMKETPSWVCGSEQYLFTRLVEKYPELFHIMSYDYGNIAFLWGTHPPP